MTTRVPFYEGYDIGNLGVNDSQCWVAFGPMGPRPNEYRYWTHQTMNLASDGLRVFVNGELQEATDRVKRVLRRSPATLRIKLQELHAFELFELVLGREFTSWPADSTTRLR